MKAYKRLFCTRSEVVPLVIETIHYVTLGHFLFFKASIVSLLIHRLILCVTLMFVSSRSLRLSPVAFMPGLDIKTER